WWLLCDNYFLSSTVHDTQGLDLDSHRINRPSFCYVDFIRFPVRSSESCSTHRNHVVLDHPCVGRCCSPWTLSIRIYSEKNSRIRFITLVDLGNFRILHS